VEDVEADGRLLSASPSRRTRKLDALIKLGLRPEFIQAGTLPQNGRHERMHRREGDQAARPELHVIHSSSRAIPTPQTPRRDHANSGTVH
jgi:hypothetical protein